MLFLMSGVFSGKKAYVVGGTGGIGRAIGVALALAGASVVAIGRRSLPDMETLCADLDDPQERERVFEVVRSADILCVARGPFLQRGLADMSFDEWQNIVSANLAFPGSLVSSALPHMIASSWGRILLFGGTRTDAVRGFRTNAAYASAKTGLASLVKSVALEYAGCGVTANLICPGFVDTEYLNLTDRNALKAKNPDGKLIPAEQIAELALFLLKNDTFNGAIVAADKGWEPSFI